MEFNRPQFFKDENAKKEFHNLPDIKKLNLDDLRSDDIAIRNMAEGIFEASEERAEFDGIISPSFYQKNIVDRFERLFRAIEVEETRIKKDIKTRKKTMHQAEFDLLDKRLNELAIRYNQLLDLETVVDKQYDKFTETLLLGNKNTIEKIPISKDLLFPN